MIDLDDIRTRYQQACKFLDERGRRLFAANEALALGHGGVTATSAATGLARSTIRRAIVELQSGAILVPAASTGVTSFCASRLRLNLQVRAARRQRCH